MTFRVGQKVVCVDDGNSVINNIESYWEEGSKIFQGRIYTVHSTFPHPKEGRLMLRLLEVRRGLACIRCNGHDGYGARRFRPVVERKTDISVFTEILRTTKAPVNADARCFVSSQELGGARG